MPFVQNCTLNPERYKRRLELLEIPRVSRVSQKLCSWARPAQCLDGGEINGPSVAAYEVSHKKSLRSSHEHQQVLLDPQSKAAAAPDG